MKSIAHKLIKLVLALTVVAIIGYMAFTYFAYRFTGEDYAQMRDSNLAANEYASGLAATIQKSMPLHHEEITKNGTQAGVEEECSGVIYQIKQGIKSIYCQQTFVTYIGVEEADFLTTKAKLIKTLSKQTGFRIKYDEYNGEERYKWESVFNSMANGASIEVEMKINVLSDANKTSEFLKYNPELKGLTEKYSYVFDIYYRHKYYASTKPRNVIEYFRL